MDETKVSLPEIPAEELRDLAARLRKIEDDLRQATRDAEGVEAGNIGKLSHAADQAGDALFSLLNIATSYLPDHYGSIEPVVMDWHKREERIRERVLVGDQDGDGE